MTSTTSRPGVGHDVIVLDGGMGKELQRIGAPFGQPEWSALALMEAPEKVMEAHRNFIEAGADVIITNTYAVVGYHLGDDVFAARGRELAELAGRLARDVADGADRPVMVAGSLPPLFGSYRPANFRPDVAPDQWRMLAEAQSPYVDFWLGETIGSTAEAKVLAEAVDEVESEQAPTGAGEVGAAVVGADTQTDTAVPDRADADASRPDTPDGGVGHPHRPRPLWLSFTLEDELVDGRARLYSGETIVDVAQVAVDRAEAVLFNCARPEVMAPALSELADILGADGLAHTRIGAYANAFPEREEGYEANSVILERRAELTGQATLELATEWKNLGATIIGGCCGMHPEHIAPFTSLK